MAAGLRQVEVTNFVNPIWIHQLADAQDVCRRIVREHGVKYPVLVPNIKVYQSFALASFLQRFILKHCLSGDNPVAVCIPPCCACNWHSQFNVDLYQR